MQATQNTYVVEQQREGNNTCRVYIHARAGTPKNGVAVLLHTQGPAHAALGNGKRTLVLPCWLQGRSVVEG